MDPPASVSMSIFTAVPASRVDGATQTSPVEECPTTDLREPLLLDAESSDSREQNTVIDEGDDASVAGEDVHILAAVMARFRLAGLALGLVVQMLNVGGTTYLFLRWGAEGAALASAASGDDRALHLLVLLFSQADLYLYVSMWLCLTGLLTQTGMRFARRKFFSEVSVPPSKRSVFIMGVNFYVGVVVGVFLAWTGIDMVLGLPVPVMPMVGVLLFGLAISYAMIWCYDMEEGEAQEERPAAEIC